MKNLYYWYGYSYILRTGRNDKLNMCSCNIIHTCRYCLYWENIKCLYLYCELFNIYNIKCNLEFPKTWFFQQLVLVPEMCPLAYCCRMCSICIVMSVDNSCMFSCVKSCLSRSHWIYQEKKRIPIATWECIKISNLHDMYGHRKKFVSEYISEIYRKYLKNF